MLKELKNRISDIPDFPKPGILFKDISPILLDSRLCNFIIETLCQRIEDHNIDIIVGIESRGFLFGMGMAQKLGVGFVPARKRGKLPGETVSVSYQLEYGEETLEIQKNIIGNGKRIHVHDDLIATGGSAVAASQLVEIEGGEVASFSFIIELLELGGRASISNHSQLIESLVAY